MTKNPLRSKPPEPQFHGRVFDPWNSVTTGHQRVEGRGPNSWRENRTRKLDSQFRGGNGGGRRVQDKVGPGADPEQRERALAKPALSVLDIMRKPESMKKPATATAPKDVDAAITAEDRLAAKRKAKDDEAAAAREAPGSKRGIFEGLVVYINGSTHPLISDHKLKRVLVEQGARTSLHLGRRQVTHVIVGRPAAAPSPATSVVYGSGDTSGSKKGAGGGLAGGKIQREITRMRGGCGVKFVGVEW